MNDPRRASVGNYFREDSFERINENNVYSWRFFKKEL